MKTINVAKRFYEERFRASTHKAYSSWETWKGSWAGLLWIEKHKDEIIHTYEVDKKRFGGWCHNYVLGI